MSDPFAAHATRYDRWYDRHPRAYAAELAALRALLPPFRMGLEVGVGTGRFAAPLGVGFGVDPSLPMLALARSRGIRVAAARGEALPFPAARFDLVLAVATWCFLDDPNAFLAESARVLGPGGHLLLGLLDWEAPAARGYLAGKADDPFYRHARPTGARQVDATLRRAGWRTRIWKQALMTGPEDSSPPRPGHGEGLFAAVLASRA